MSVGKLSPPILIVRPSALKRLAIELSKEPIVAVDTESNSLYAYREQVCLLQFSTPTADYLVDTLSLDDLSSLAPFFADPDTEKVFHAAEYDLICLRRDFGIEFANIFDTMVAAGILGRESIGLGSLLQTEFNVHLEKRFQRANWGQRPIPQHLLSYAQLDTHYLITLRDRLRKILVQRDLWQLAKEDFKRLEKVRSNGDRHFSKKDKSAGCWRISGSYDLEPQQAAILLQLCQYRDSVARSKNQPLFKVMSDRTLLAIAKNIPENPNDLGRLLGMSKNQINRYGTQILSAVRKGLHDKPAYPPKVPRQNGHFHERLEALRSWRKNTAQKMGVNSNIVLPRDLLLSIAKSNPNQTDELEAILAEVPWRLDHFGDQILNILSHQNSSDGR